MLCQRSIELTVSLQEKVDLPDLPAEELAKQDEPEEEEEEEEPELQDEPAKPAKHSTKPAKKFRMTKMFGGDGGDVFDHKNHRRVKKLTIYSGSRHVDGIELTYEGNETLKNGGTGGKPQSIELDSDEYINKIEIRFSDIVQCLTFTTNAGKTLGPCGGSGGMMGKSGTELKIKAPSGMKLCGVKGRAGGKLDAIAFRWAPCKSA